MRRAASCESGECQHALSGRPRLQLSFLVEQLFASKDIVGRFRHPFFTSAFAVFAVWRERVEKNLLDGCPDLLDEVILDQLRDGVDYELNKSLAFAREWETATTDFV
jgi:hypothetical protein